MGSANSNVVQLNVLAPAATPTFNPVAGTYTGTQNIVISCSTPGSTIYYTTDGSTPTTSSAVYSTPVPVSAPGGTLKAIATAPSFAQSAVGSAAYVINPVVTVNITWQSGDNSNGPLGFGSSEGWATQDSANFPVITSGVGNIVSPIPPTYGGAQVGMAGCFISNLGVNTINVFIKGTQAQNFFSQLSYTGKSGPESYLTSAATFDTSSYPGYSWWHWPALHNFPFNNGQNYTVTITP